MSLTIWQVDAFADAPLTGNPAAVCILPEARDAVWMQAIGREMNLSETAFLVRREDNSYDLRWFTPTHEVDLCGHATLASAHVLWEEQLLKADDQARFHTKSWLLTADRDGDWIELNFPATPPEPAQAPPSLVQALNAAPVYCGRTLYDFLVEVESETILRKLVPDFTLLMTVPARGTIVTARASTPGFDYVCRFFAPAGGVNEDPVTGSAQSALGPYWQAKLGKDELLGYQASTPVNPPTP